MLSNESNDECRVIFAIRGHVLGFFGRVFGSGNEKDAPSVAVADCALYFGIR